MKGFSHFSIGVAAATCFPAAVAAGADGNSLPFIIGGAFGLLPDTLDFKFYRFLYKHDCEVTPDPLVPNPKLIADAVASAVHAAHEKRKPFRVKLNTIRLGTDRWQSYEVVFDVPARRIVVRYGPVVDTGGEPLEDLKPGRQLEASASLACGIKLDYLAATRIDIFDGPVFKMKPDGKDADTIVPEFIPWHRAWSHSVTIGLGCSALCGLLFGPLAGVIGMSAYTAHILLDQLGHMGSNLFYPFTRSRSPGSGVVRSGQPWPNFMTVWTSCLIIFWNLSRATAGISPLNPLKLAALGLGLPAAGLVILRARGKRRRG